MGSRKQSFTDQIRAAVDASGMSRYRICKELNLNEATMSRFMSGGGGVSMRTLDRLAELLALRVVSDQTLIKRTVADGKRGDK